MRRFREYLTVGRRLSGESNKDEWLRTVKAWGGFSAEEYAALNPDLKMPRILLRRHYFRHGMFEDRAPNATVLLDAYKTTRNMHSKQPGPTIYHMILENAPELRGELARVEPADDPVRKKIEEWGGFDADYYLRANPDVAAAGVDPLAHFCESGLYECRDPNKEMNVRKYCFENEAKDFKIAPALFWMINDQDEQKNS